METNQEPSARYRKAATGLVLFCLAWLVFSDDVVRHLNSAGGERPTYALAINCMAGECQDPVKEEIRRRYRVDFVDMVTEAGPAELLARDPADDFEKDVLKNIKRRAEVSIKGHGAKIVAIVAHDLCSGNPGPKDKKKDKERQLKQLRQAKERLLVELAVMGYREVEVILLWVENHGRQTKVIHVG